MYLLADVIDAYMQGMKDAERLVRYRDGVGTHPECADVIRQHIDGSGRVNGETAEDRARSFASARNNRSG